MILGWKLCELGWSGLVRSPPKAGSTGGPTGSIGMPLSEVMLTTGGPLIASEALGTVLSAPEVMRAPNFIL